MQYHKMLPKVIAHFGTQMALADKLGIHRQQIHMWLYCKAQIPLKHAVAIERLTKKKFKAVDLLSKRKRIYLNE